MENINTSKELFSNIRSAVRLMYEYQKRMQGTMFHIKSVLNLSPSGRIEINKLYSRAPRASKDYGESQLSNDNWAWDYIYPMAMEYYLGEKRINGADFCVSAIQVTDDGYYKAIQQSLPVNRLDTYGYVDSNEAESWVVFVMEIRTKDSQWAKRWNRDTMESNLNKWMLDTRSVIEDVTRQGNNFIVMKFPLERLLGEKAIHHVLNEIDAEVSKTTDIHIL